jgi:hypothetical protein
MAYITRETSAKIRKALKAHYPEIKFSVTIDNNSSLHVTVLESPYFAEGARASVNQYWIAEHYHGEQRAVLRGILQIIKEEGEWYNNSDIMTDYFDTAFYIEMSIGRYNRLHTFKNI